MKKWIMAIVCLMTMVLVSCGTKTYMVSANYDVCFPDGTKTYETTKIVKSTCTPNVSCYSFQGTNYVYIPYGEVTFMNQKDDKKNIILTSSTAPMRLNSYHIEECKKTKARCIAVNKKGKKCNNVAEKGKQYCWKHE